MLKEVKGYVGFEPDVKVIKTSVDRLDIKLILRPLEYAIMSFKDLKFLIEPAKKPTS